ARGTPVLLEHLRPHQRRYPLEKALPRYAEAFARYGIHPGMDPAEVKDRIEQRPAAVRDVLVSGLESWWVIAWNQDVGPIDWLGAVLQAADPDEWRTQVRQAVVGQDRPTLEKLAQQADAARQPKATANSLTWGLCSLGAFDAAVAVLRPAQQRHPDDF